MVEAVEGLEDIQAAGAQGHFLHRYEAANAASATRRRCARGAFPASHNFAMVSQQLVTVIMLVWGVHLIDAKSLSPGAMIACVMFGRAIAPLTVWSSLATRYQGATAACACSTAS